MQAKKYKAYLADKSGDLTYFHMSTLTDKIGSAWENDTSKGTRMPFYIQYLSLLNYWHFTEAINIQWTLQDGEWRSTKIWQHSPLTRPRERLSAKGSCHGYITNGVVTFHGREETWKIDQLFGLHLQWRYLLSESGKYWGKKEQAFKCCKHFWFSEMLPTHYPLFLLLDFWLFTISRKHPLIYLLAAFMFPWTPMLPSFTNQMFSENAFQSHCKLLKEAES